MCIVFVGYSSIVYPACAGIDLCDIIKVEEMSSLPRMRGDRPWTVDVITKEREFTPHARGSTLPKKLTRLM